MFDNIKQNLEKKAAAALVSGLIKNYADDNLTNAEATRQAYNLANASYRIVESNYNTFKSGFKLFNAIKESAIKRTNPDDLDIIVRVIKDIKKSIIVKNQKGESSQTTG